MVDKGNMKDALAAKEATLKEEANKRRRKKVKL